MAWTAVVTNVGATLLASYVQGEKLVIVRGQCGDGRVSEAVLIQQTSLSGSFRGNVNIQSSEIVTGGVRINLLLRPYDSSHSISQIGIRAKLDGQTDEESVLLAIYQCAEGEEIHIPAYADMRDFAYGFSAIIAMDNTGELAVNINSGIYVTNGQFQTLSDTVTEIETDVGTLQTDVSAIDGRVEDLEALGDPVTVAHGGTGATTAAAARTNLSAAATFALSSSAWSGLYATLNTLEQGQGAIYRSVAAASQTLVGLSGMMWGTVARLNATVFEFMARTAGGANLYMWRVTFSSDGTSATVENKYVQTFSAVT